MQSEFWMKVIIILYRHYFKLALEPCNTNFPLQQVLWAGTRKSVLLTENLGERRTPRDFGLILTLLFASPCNLS